MRLRRQSRCRCPLSRRRFPRKSNRPRSNRRLLSPGTATAAFWDFACFYVVAALITFGVYVRRTSITAVGEPAMAAA
ncbi:hypothetical protein [Mycobacterium sp. 1245111.1]|uniref:hypothetical protein n=1 Tax=Mycobacterium sp. 1245111.1 TaxID=1834073 RepID=UPI0012E9BC8F|nr:hypothetical protein [Mycobacterium sp. 1245111.1]